MRKEKLTVVQSLAASVLMATFLQVDAGEEDIRSLATAECQVPGLTVMPPSPWYSVPIDSKEPMIAGCQMLWEEGNQYMGIMRLVSFEVREMPTDGVKWEDLVVAFESKVMERMNIKVGKPIWKRDRVPITGDGFSNAKAIGLTASLEGVAHPNEAHFLLFESPTHKYVISMLTPAKSASPDVYRSNTKAMGRVMRTLQPR